MDTNKIINGMVLAFMGSAALITIYYQQWERAYALLGMMGFYAFGYKNGGSSTSKEP